MAMSNKVGKKELVIAVVAVAAGLWYVWPSSNESQPVVRAAQAKTATAVVSSQVTPATAIAIQAKPKRSPASILKDDQDVLDYYYHIAHAAQGDNPDGSDCANQAASYLSNYQGAQGAHDAYVHNPQQAVERANEFSKENPSLHIPLQSVDDAPSELLKEDKKALAEAQNWFAKHGCRT